MNVHHILTINHCSSVNQQMRGERLGFPALTSPINTENEIFRLISAFGWPFETKKMIKGEDVRIANSLLYLTLIRSINRYGEKYEFHKDKCLV